MASSYAVRLKAHVGIVFFGNGILIATWSPHIPWIGERHEFDDAGIGLLLLTMGAGAVTAMSGAGRIAARYGGERVTRIAAVVFAVMLPLAIAAPTRPLVFAAVVLLGGSIGSMDVAMNAVGVDVERRMGRPSMSFFHGGFSAGALAGAGIAYVVLHAGATPVQHAVGMSIAVSVGWAYSLRALPRDESSDGPSGHAARSAEPSRGLRARIGGLSLALITIAVLAIIVLAAEGTVVDWSAKLLRDDLHTSAAVAAIGFGAFSVTMAAGRFAGDWVNTHIGPVALVRWGGLLAAIGLGVAVATGTVWGAIAGYAVMGLGLANTVPVLFTAGARLGRTSAEGVGAVATAGYAGFLIAPPVVGFIARETSLPLALGVVAAVVLLVPVAAGAIARGETARGEKAARAA